MLGCKGNVSHISVLRESSALLLIGEGGISFPFLGETENGRESRGNTKPEGFENAMHDGKLVGLELLSAEQRSSIH